MNKLVSQNEVDFMKVQIDALEKESIVLRKKYEERGKALNKLWEKGKELRKEIATLQKFCGKMTYDIARLHLENRLIIPARQKDCPGTQILVRDIVRQLINESGYDLEFKVLQKKTSLTITGKEIKK